MAPAYPAHAAVIGPLGLAEDRPPDGALRAGDELIVEVTSGKVTKSLQGTVDARGDVHIAAGRDIAVGGMSLQSAEQRATDAVRTRDKFAEVNLQLLSRPTQRVSVIGALAKPGFVELRPGMRVADVVAASGGLRTVVGADGGLPSAVADLDGAVLERDGQPLPISLRKALRGEPGHNVLVHPADQLYVPFATAQLVSVFGQVASPSVLPHHAGLRMTEALSAAGGLTVGADKSDIRLVRGPPDAPKAYRASLRAIANGEQHDVALQPGDVLFVQDAFNEDFGEVVELAAPLVAIGIAALALSLILSQ